MSVLSLETIYYRYEDSQKYVLNDLNATFEEGKFYAVVGKSGAGKSTFLSLLAGLDRQSNERKSVFQWARYCARFIQ